MKFLIAGFGSIGRRHFQNLLSLGERELVFYRTQKGVLEEPDLANFPVENDLEKALDHQPDAVIVSNPTAYHLDVAQPAAERGCHILLEKPVSHNLDGVHTLLETAKSSGSRILIGYQFRFHPHLQQIRAWLAESGVGSMYFVRAHWGEYLPDWHPWEDYRAGYSARKDLGGGVILTLSHPLDYLLWLFGGIAEVSAAAGAADRLEIEVEELVSATVRFQTGLLGTVHLNYLQRPPYHGLEILGTVFDIRWDYQSGELMKTFHTDESREVLKLPESWTRNDLFLKEISHFREVVRGGMSPRCSLEEGIEVQKVCSALHTSLQHGAWVHPSEMHAER